MLKANRKLDTVEFLEINDNNLEELFKIRAKNPTISIVLVEGGGPEHHIDNVMVTSGMGTFRGRIGDFLVKNAKNEWDIYTKKEFNESYNIVKQ